MTAEEEEASLLRPGQTVEEWWAEFGMDVESTRAKRRAAYVVQRAETLGKARIIAARRMIVQDNISFGRKFDIVRFVLH